MRPPQGRRVRDEGAPCGDQADEQRSQAREGAEQGEAERVQSQAPATDHGLAHDHVQALGQLGDELDEEPGPRDVQLAHHGHGRPADDARDDQHPERAQALEADKARQHKCDGNVALLHELRERDAAIQVHPIRGEEGDRAGAAYGQEPFQCRELPALQAGQGGEEARSYPEQREGDRGGASHLQPSERHGEWETTFVHQVLVQPHRRGGHRDESQDQKQALDGVEDHQSW
mmetsp:Transcript_103848/g.318071  ORF Transcript_103848/g.318071 Transcript_103848/m.318071 type:complete len:231 (-) Transcript_103848:191-883(-)